MSSLWQKITDAEFASYEEILGHRVIPMDGIYWRRVRPLFYRPLLPFKEYRLGSVKPPLPSLLGGFQHAVAPGETANSFINLLMFEDAEIYSLESLNDQHRRQVRQAAKKFIVRSIADVGVFKQEAYPVYLSFYERTRYQVGARRKNQAVFCRWAEALFQIPNVVVLGGYRDGRLGGVSVSLLLGDTLCYPTVFCDTESLRLQLSSFLLHSVREAVAKSKCARQIFAGLTKIDHDSSVDDFYFQRGCKMVRKPAFLHLNPLAEFLVKRYRPEQYGRLQDFESAKVKNFVAIA